MRNLIDIIEGSTHANMEVYHWTSAENLMRILNSDTIQIGASEHTLGGKTLSGVSVTRDAFLDLSNTYAVSGKKAWRIGLNYAALKQRFRLQPIRDDYLRKRPRGVWAKQTRRIPFTDLKDTTYTPHDEMEEFVLGDITPLERYVTSIAVEDRWVDGTSHPREVEDDPDYFEQEFDIETDDQVLFFSILAQSDPDLYHKLIRNRAWRPRYVQWIEGVPLQILNREPHQVRSVEQAYAWVLNPSVEHDDDEEDQA